ncbi:MAG TPA: hypothetical protein VGD13_11735 [Xanthobacteraceae bacterium]
MSKSENLPATSRRPRRPGPVRIRIKGVQANVVSFASPGPADHVWRRQLKAALGTASDAFVDMALHHLERAARMPGDGPSNVSINGALAIIAAFAPRNEAEAALALQAACTHMVAMVMMARIGGGHGGDRRLPALASAAAKLMRTHCLQVETFRRLRGGGEQKIIVKHVTVNEGGQAIVGAVNSQALEVVR